MSNLFGGSSTHNYPAQPTYGEGMADAMKAQMEMLTGQGDFAEIYKDALGEEGSLQDILRQFEAPLRKETAQLDTDVLRQTLLGGEQKVQRVEQPDGSFKYGIPGATPVTSEQVGGAPTQSAGGRYQLIGSSGNLQVFNTSSGGVMSHADELKELERQGLIKSDGHSKPYGATKAGEYYKLTSAGEKAGLPKLTMKNGEEWFGKPPGPGGYQMFSPANAPGSMRPYDRGQWGGLPDKVKGMVFEGFSTNLAKASADQGVPESEVKLEFEWNDPNTGQPLKEGDVVREGTGMLDLFGPKGIAEYDPETGERVGVRDYAAEHPAYASWAEKVRADDPTLAWGKSELAEEFGVNVDDLSEDELADLHWRKFGKDQGWKRPGGTYKQAGFATQADVDAGRASGVGEFMGLTALGADVSADLATRQRTRDIGDVQRLGQRATEAYRQQGVQYDPATGEAIAGTGIAGTLAEARRLGPGGAAGYSAISDGPLFSGGAKTSLQDTAEGMRPGAYEQLRTDMPTIEAGRIGGDYRAFDPETGAAFDVKAKEYGTDPLRMAMLQQVQEGLGEGLTEREQRTLREAARSRATAMGRTFDPTATIDELKIQMMEDEARRAQRLQQAQSVLGQEAQIQTSDLGRDVQAQLANLEAGQQAGQFDISQEIGRQQAQVGRELGAAESDVERAMRQQAMSEQYRQAGLGQERAAAAQMVGLEQATGADPFQAILGRPSGAGAQMGQQMFGQAGYGLQSAPQYLNPEAGLGYISNRAANEASMWGAGQMAQAGKQRGLFGALGSLGGAAIGKWCWVAREVYGAHNPAWLDFREWMLLRAPSWFRALYIGYGERFAKFISDKPRLKARIRGWMDTKIGRV